MESHHKTYSFNSATGKFVEEPGLDLPFNFFSIKSLRANSWWCCLCTRNGCFRPNQNCYTVCPGKIWYSKYGIFSNFVFDLMLARNNTDWELVSGSSLVSAVSVTRWYISHQKYGSNIQISKALWKMVVVFLVKKMVILDSRGNHLYVKESLASFTKIGAPL